MNTDPTPAAPRVDVYVRTRNVVRAGMRTFQIGDDITLDYQADHNGVERLSGVEVIGARGVEVDGLDVKTGRPHGVGPAVGGAGTATPPAARDTASDDLRSLRRAAVDVLDEIDRTGQLGEDDPEVGCLRDALSSPAAATPGEPSPPADRSITEHQDAIWAGLEKFEAELAASAVDRVETAARVLHDRRHPLGYGDTCDRCRADARAVADALTPKETR